MCVCVQGTNADGSSTLQEGDIGPHPRTWGGVQLEVGDKQFFYFREGDPPPQFDPEADPQDYIGAPKGMMQVLFERGWYVHGMTANGERETFLPENPDAWQPNDLVIRNEGDDSDPSSTKRCLYRIRLVPADHTEVASDDNIECEWMVVRKWRGKNVYAPSGKTWVFPSNTLSSVARDAYHIEHGKMKNKKMLRISMDVEVYWQSKLHNDQVSFTILIGRISPRGAS